MSVWSGLGGVWTKAAKAAAARQAPEPTRSATLGPPVEMIHPVRMTQATAKFGAPAVAAKVTPNPRAAKSRYREEACDYEGQGSLP